MRTDKQTRPFITVFYLHGRCHIFALALHLALGYRIEALWNSEPLSDDGDFGERALVHAYCRRPDGQMVDASGVISKDQLYSDYGELPNSPEAECLTPQAMRAYIRNRILERPQPCEVQNLVQYILAHRALYKPAKSSKQERSR
jgi:hypothetical protein